MQSLTVIAESVMHADASTTALFGLSVGEVTSALARMLPGAHLAWII